MGAVDTANFVTAKANVVGDGVKMGQITNIYHHALHQNEATYQDEMLLGMRGMAYEGFTSGDQIVRISTGEEGKLSICVGSGDDKKFLVYWQHSGQGYVYPREMMKKQPPNDGWNDANINTICDVIKSVQAKGGLTKVLGDDGKMRSFIHEVSQNAEHSKQVYAGALTGVTSDPRYQELQHLIENLQKLLPTEKVLHARADQFKSNPVGLYNTAKGAKPAFDQILTELAASTGGEPIPAGLKKVERSCEKVDKLDCC